MRNDEHDDISIEPEQEERDGFGKSKKEKDLLEKLKHSEAERKDFLEGWQRAKADLINQRKDFEKERQAIIARANEDLVLDLSKVLVSFDMAFANKESWEKVDETWRKGVEFIYKDLLSTLARYGVEEIIPSEGEEFDPHKHEAVGVTSTSDEAKDGHVASLQRKGYALNGRLIEPARVLVYEITAK